MVNKVVVLDISCGSRRKQDLTLLMQEGGWIVVARSRYVSKGEILFVRLTSPAKTAR